MASPPFPPPAWVQQQDLTAAALTESVLSLLTPMTSSLENRPALLAMQHHLQLLDTGGTSLKRLVAVLSSTVADALERDVQSTYRYDGTSYSSNADDSDDDDDDDVRGKSVIPNAATRRASGRNATDDDDDDNDATDEDDDATDDDGDDDEQDDDEEEDDDADEQEGERDGLDLNASMSSVHPDGAAGCATTRDV